MTEEDKNDGNKFALAFLAASGSILYTIYNIMQNAPINKDSFYLINLVVAGAIISIVGFLIYLLIKGYLMEVHSISNIDYLNKLASELYKGSIIIFAFFACLILFMFLDLNVPSEIKKYINMIFCVVIGLFYFLIVIFYIRVYLTKNTKYKDWKFNKGDFALNKREFIVFFIGIIIFIILFLTFLCVVLYAPLHGHVEVDMNSIHYKNDTHIPVLIQITGPNTGLYTILYQKLSDNMSSISHIGPIEPILLDLESDLEKHNIESNDILLGDYLGNGKYIVFINTTNLTEGYYELLCLRIDFYEESERKGFYLLNRS